MENDNDKTRTHIALTSGMMVREGGKPSPSESSTSNTSSCPTSGSATVKSARNSKSAGPEKPPPDVYPEPKTRPSRPRSSQTTFDSEVLVRLDDAWTTVREDDEIMLISSSGTLVRTAVSDISVIGRNTQGVTLIRVESGQRLVGLARIESIEDAEE